MYFFRKILLFNAFILFAIGAVIIGFIIFPLLNIFNRNPKKVAANVVRSSWRFLINYLEFCKIIKLNYPKDIALISNKIIVASHLSYIDIVILIALIPNSVCLAKKALLNNFFMKNIVNMLYITNDLDISDFEKQSQSVLEEGFNIIIFPTGGRVLPCEEIHIHKGASAISIKNNVDIVPIEIVMSHPFLQKNHPFYELPRDVVEYTLIVKDEIVPSKLNEFESSEIVLRNKICKLIKENID